MCWCNPNLRTTVCSNCFTPAISKFANGLAHDDLNKQGYWEISSQYVRYELFFGTYYNAVRCATLYIQPGCALPIIKEVKVATIDDIQTRLSKAKTKKDIENEIVRLQEQLNNESY